MKAVAERGKGDPVAVFAIYNNGAVGLRSGSLTFIMEAVVPALASIGMEREVLFSGKERRGSVLHPLLLRFDDEDALSDRSRNQDFIRALTSVDRCAVAVFHANPYIHCLYADFKDGSSFNLFSTSPSEVEIVPSTRASVAALTKLYRGISEKFADCSISEHTEVNPTLGDFFGA